MKFKKKEYKGYPGKSFYLGKIRDSMGLIPDDFPDKPFGLIVHTTRQIDSAFWKNSLDLLQNEGAEWFCASGPHAKKLEEIWDTIASGKEKGKEDYVLISVSDATLQDALESFHLTGTDSRISSGLAGLMKNCVVLIDEACRL